MPGSKVSLGRGVEGFVQFAVPRSCLDVSMTVAASATSRTALDDFHARP